MSNDSTFELMARLVLSLAVVLGLMWVMALVMRKRGLTNFGGNRRANTRGSEIHVIAKRSLGRNASIAIVKAGQKAMIVGITDHNITKLEDAEIEEIDLEDGDGQWTAGAKEPTRSGQAWKTMLDHVRERTVRR